jgi:hypothetical protein
MPVLLLLGANSMLESKCCSTGLCRTIKGLEIVTLSWDDHIPAKALRSLFGASIIWSEEACHDFSSFIFHTSVIHPELNGVCSNPC